MTAAAAVVALAVAAAFAAIKIAAAGLLSPAFFSGWILAAALIVLAGFGLRRRLPEIPAGRGARWMRAHNCGGLFAIAAFFLHAGVPDAPSEAVLWGLFAVVALSGGFGLFLSRVIPPRIRAAGGVAAALIPRRRREIAARAEALCAPSLFRGDRRSLACFYAFELRPFFAAPRHLRRHLALSDAPRNRLLRRADEVARMMDGEGKTVVAALRDLIAEKDRLDFHAAMHAALRGWLFVHLPATGALLLFSAAHIAAAYGFALDGR